MKNKILNLDIARFIASLMIVAIHVYPFSSFSETFDFIVTRVLFRIAVPLFLMITGYYVLPKILQDKKALIAYTKKILILYGFSIIIYFPLQFLNGSFTILSFFSILKMIVFTGTFYHLWYFPALILGLWFIYYIIHFVPEKIVLSLLILFYIIGLFGDSYYGVIQGYPIFSSFYDSIFLLTDYTRNGIFYVPIFLYLGYFFSFSKRKISFHKNVLLFFTFFILMGLEGSFLYMGNISRHTSMYFFLPFTCYFLFACFQECEQKSNLFFRGLSTSIYIWHPMIIAGVHFLTKVFIFSIFLSNSFVFYIVVLLITIFFSILLNFLKKCSFLKAT